MFQNDKYSSHLNRRHLILSGPIWRKTIGTTIKILKRKKVTAGDPFHYHNTCVNTIPSNTIMRNQTQLREREREEEVIPGIENDWGKQIKEEQVLTKDKYLRTLEFADQQHHHSSAQALYQTTHSATSQKQEDT
jgi:hypothetical protein